MKVRYVMGGHTINGGHEEDVPDRRPSALPALAVSAAGCAGAT